MTVGIALTNGLEALVITDRRVSQGNRQSDSYTKIGEFTHKNYSGVVFGTGSGNALLGVSRNLSTKNEELDGFVRATFDDYRKHWDAYDKDWLDEEKRLIRNKASLTDAPERKTKVTEYEERELMAKYEREQSNPQNRTEFMNVAYDQ